MTRKIFVLLVCLMLSACAWQKPKVEPEKPERQTGKMEPVTGERLDSLTRDTDSDGLFDHFESVLKTSSEKSDTDDDGYTDRFEYEYYNFGFNPIEPSVDSDRDGLTDPFEVERGISPTKVDSDEDGWSDFDEILNARFGFDPRRKTGDKDFDGLSDSLERELGTDIAVPDTDGDGATDFQEVAAGSDPLYFNDVFGQEIGTTYSRAIKNAIKAIRGGGKFSDELAKQLPYPEVTSVLVLEFNVVPSAALMQQSVYNPSSSPSLYDRYNDIVKRLQKVATVYGLGSGNYLARLFVWSAQTIDGDLPGLRVYALKISDNPAQNESEPEMLFMGAHHGKEMISASIVMNLIERILSKYTIDDEVKKLVNTTEGWFIPVVNPNGYERTCSNHAAWRRTPAWYLHHNTMQALT